MGKRYPGTAASAFHLSPRYFYFWDMQRAIGVFFCFCLYTNTRRNLEKEKNPEEDGPFLVPPFRAQKGVTRAKGPRTPQPLTKWPLLRCLTCPFYFFFSFSKKKMFLHGGNLTQQVAWGTCFVWGHHHSQVDYILDVVHRRHYTGFIGGRKPSAESIAAKGVSARFR